MTESTHTNPVAVPWTPDMAGQNAPAPAQNAPQNIPTHAAPVAPQPFPVQSHQANPVGHAAAPVQPQQPYPGQAAPHVHRQPAPQMAPQAPAGYPQIHAPQGHIGQPQMPQTQHQPQHMAPAPQLPQSGQAQPAHQAPAPRYTPAQHVPPHVQPHQAHHQSPPAHAAPQQGQPGAMPPHMQHTEMQSVHEQAKPNSLMSRLLKRSPKPTQQQGGHYGDQMQAPALAAMQNAVPQMASAPHLMSQAKPASGSLFNKNFALGAVTGLVIGAFVLPMIINLFAGDPAPQTLAQSDSQIQPQSAQSETVPGIDINMPASKHGQTFLDAAIAADES